MSMAQRPPYNRYDGEEFEEEFEEEEEEEEERQGRGVNSFDIPRDQRRVRIGNSRSRKVTFDPRTNTDTQDNEQAEAEAAANQLQTEHRQAGSSRVTRSSSPTKRNVSRVDSHRGSQERDYPARRSPSKGPAPALSRRIPEGQTKAFRYPASADLTPPENLTPQEKKGNDLDAEVMAALAGLRKRITEFCNDAFRKELLPKDTAESTLKTWLAGIKKESELEFIAFCRAIAEGGGEAQTWLQVVANKECRFGLSFGIINRVLVQHVFGSLLFGAPQDLLVKLEQMEKFQENEDGFYREEHRAEHITSYEIQYRVDLNESAERKLANLKTSLQIWMLLEPLYQLDSRNRTPYEQLQQVLITIVATAARLATLMRKSGKTVLYSFSQVYKDQVADRKTMEVLNFEQLKEEHDKGDGADQVLIRMVCGDELYAFRKGGGVMAERILEREEKEQDVSVAPELRHMPRNQYRGRLITAQDGYRAKFVAKAQVLGRLEQIGSEQKAKDLMDAIRVLREGGCRTQ